MERVTSDDVRRALTRWFVAAGVPFEDRGSYVIESWAPGDGKRRYRLERDGRSVGPFYCFGTRAMYDWLWAGIYTLEEAERLRMAKREVA